MAPGDTSIASASPLVPANYNLTDIFSKINPKNSHGYSIADVYDFFDKLDYQTDRANGEGKSNGTISALECAAALIKEKRLTEAQKTQSTRRYPHSFSAISLRFSYRKSHI